MSNNNIKKLSIQNTVGSYDTRDVGMEAQNATVSYDTNDQVIEDIDVTTPVSTKSIAKAVKDIEASLSGKANASALRSKADLDSSTGLVRTDQLPDDVDDIIEGYYKEADGKFYSNYNPSTHVYSDEITGQTGKIYVDKLTNGMFRWAAAPASIFVKIVNLADMDLEDLANVNLGTVQDGESLVYDSTSQKWVNKMQTAHYVTPPNVSGSSFTYNGTAQGPTITKSQDFDTYVTTTGATATDAGSYTVTFTLKNTGVDMWSDLTTADKTYNYTINKANGSVVLASNSVTLDDDHKVVSVNITNTTGTVSASSSATSIATVTATNSAVTITATEETGSATITVTAAASTNYNAASKTIAVTANFLTLVSWETGTDEQITKMVQAYYSGKATLAQIQQVWAVGQERNVNLSAMTDTTDIVNTEVSGVTNTLTPKTHRAQTVKMVILDFNHDTLTTSQGGKTKALVTLGQKDCLRDATVTDEGGSSNAEHGRLNNSNTNNGGWKGCPRRTWCNNNYYNALPSYLKSLIKPVNKLTSEGIKSTNIITTQDKCWLASEKEIFGTNSSSVNGEGTQYSYYATASNRYKLPKWNNSSVSDWWWGRSPNLKDSSAFCAVNNSGVVYGYATPSTSIGLAPACCL